MNELSKIFGQNEGFKSFDELKITIAAPERVKSWSFGEVKKPETINYRTFKPERDGLFCARIFGPVKDYECLCGKYKRMKYKGITCEKCGVEVTLSKVRRDRMGHIDVGGSCCPHLVLEVIAKPDRFAAGHDLEGPRTCALFRKLIVVDPGTALGLEQNQLLTEDQYYAAQDEYGEDSFTALIGAEAIKWMLNSLDLEFLLSALREQNFAPHQ